MSRVTGMVLITSLCEGSEFRDLNEARSPWLLIDDWMAARDRGRMQPIESHGGRKDPQLLFGCMGLNYFETDEREFIAFFLAIEWDEPEHVVLVLQHEEGGTQVIRPGMR